MISKGIAVSLGVLAVTGAGAASASTQVNLSGSVDATIVQPDTGSYPDIGTISVNGVAFNTVYQNSGLGVIGGGAPETVTISTNIADVGVAYTLINSSGGANGATTGTITFTNQAGMVERFSLTEGDNVRDHFQGTYVNTASDLYGTYDSTSEERLDAQAFDLGAAFAASPLVSITFDNLGPDEAAGEPFLAAVTVDAPTGVPEPAAWALLALGVGMVGGAARRRRGAGAGAATA